MKKKFDAVKFQRKVREKLGEKYLASHKEFLRQLAAKYGGLQKQKVAV